MKSSIIRLSSLVLTIFIAVCSLTACSGKTEAEKINVKVLLLPHFEIGEMTGDSVGEAQLFYDKYFSQCEEYTLADGTILYYSPENEFAMCITGSGKANASRATTLALSDVRFDMTQAYVFGIGCSGGAKGVSTLGDVSFATSVCDFDLGHTVDAREIEDDTDAVWYHDSSFDGISYKKLDSVLLDKVYGLTKDLTLETTDISRNTMKKNFGDEEWANRDPKVILGANITSDRYWKGEYSHNTANDVLANFDADEVYTMTEMEDTAIADVADSFGMLDKLIIVRVNVNPDVFINGHDAESLWGEDMNFNDSVSEENEETLDIFEPAMRNNMLVIGTVLDAIINGTF